MRWWATGPEGPPASEARAAIATPLAAAFDVAWIVLAVLHMGQTIVFSGGARIPGTLDSRLTNLVLEHMTHALRGWTSFASPPQFHPEPGTLYYSEAHWGTFLYYAAFRLSGATAEGAFQAWILTTALLNAVAAWILVRTLGAPWWARGPLAFVASAHVILAGKLGHPQMLPLFPVLLALAALLRWARGRKAVHLAAFLVALAWVHLASVYHGFFFSVVVAILLPLLLATHGTAVVRDVRAYRGRDVGLVVAAAAIAAGTLVLLYAPYAAFAAARGWTNPLAIVQELIPGPSAWVSSQWMSWLYGTLLDVPRDLPGAYEKRLFPGFVLLAAPLVAIAVAVRQGTDRRVLLPCAVTVVLATAFVTGLGATKASPYLWLAEHVEAVRALRAPGRIAYVLLPVQVCCLTLLLRALAPRHGLLAVGLLACCVMESIGFGQARLSFDKAEAQERIRPLLERVGAGRMGDPFAVTVEAPPVGGTNAMHLDVFAVALATRRPCVNGYSGTEPAWAHVFRAAPSIEHLDRALLEIKMPPRSVEVVPLEELTGTERGTALRLPSRQWGRYRWGDEVDFGGDGTAGEFIVEGIDPAPSEWRWTQGRRAALRMTVEPSERERILVLEGMPLLGGPIRAQLVEIAANGEHVASLKLMRARREEHRVTIPASVLRGRTTLDLELVLPRARSPRELGLGDDRRVLALALTRLRVE